MKTKYDLSRSCVASAYLMAAILCLPAMRSAAPAPGLQLAAGAEAGMPFESCRGAQVLGREGQPLGDIHDFLVDEHSGQLAFAVVSTGGFLGIGDTLRLIPAAAITPGDDGSEFRVQLDREAALVVIFTRVACSTPGVRDGLA